MERNPARLAHASQRDIVSWGGELWNSPIKGGSSPLGSTYQLRLMTYRALVENEPLTILTTRPGVPSFRGLARALGRDGQGTTMNYRYTRHQVARGSRPDAVSGSKAYLFKNVSELRLTYQIRLLTVLAAERKSRVVIRIPKSAQLSRDLRDFVKANAAVLEIERVA